MNKVSKTGGKILLVVSYSLIFMICGVCAQENGAFGQDNEPSLDDVAPPPLKMFSIAEKKQLESETSLKKRTQLCLDLMEARMMKSEKLVSESAFRDSLNELAGFQALLENSLTYLDKTAVGDKGDNTYKRVEIYLRKQVPRLEVIRRAMPFKYGYYVHKLMKAVRAARAKAIEPLFGDSVVPQSKL